VVPTSIENDFKITPTQLEAAITQKLKWCGLVLIQVVLYTVEKN
jgi:aspartate/methionine/tyrosine aminotransferase